MAGGRQPHCRGCHSRTAALLVIACLVAGSRALYTIEDANGMPQIVTEEGQVIELVGANWFGFNNGQTMVDGMWDDSRGQAPTIGMKFDFPTVMYRWQLLGFNSIRLPFSFNDLYYKAPLTKLNSRCDLPTFVSRAP
jgi:hypothetical protein